MEAQRKVDLCFDTVLINEMPSLATISKQIKYCKTMESHRSILKNVLQIYLSVGVKDSILSLYWEFVSLGTEFQEEFNIWVNYGSTQGHVLEVVHNNWLIKERILAVFHSLQFTAPPQIMLNILPWSAQVDSISSQQRGAFPIFFAPEKSFISKIWTFTSSAASLSSVMCKPMLNQSLPTAKLHNLVTALPFTHCPMSREDMNYFILQPDTHFFNKMQQSFPRQHLWLPQSMLWLQRKTWKSSKKRNLNTL